MSEQNQGRYTSQKQTTYFNVRLSSDPKFFPESGEKKACTFLNFYDSTKNGTDIPISARIVGKARAELWAKLRKGDLVNVFGAVHFATKDGRVCGTIYEAEVNTTARMSDRVGGVTGDAPVEQPVSEFA